MNDLIPGRVDVMFNTTGGLMPQVRGGQVRGLAVTTAQRFPTAPELPTVAESGVPGFDVSSWYAFLVPARTPPDIVRKMHADTVTALSDPTVKARLQEHGVLVIGSTPAELARHLKSEMEKWEPVIKAAGITVRE
jgi:tripartite-type tricarboxylate transporter receptor subunit TctC